MKGKLIAIEGTDASGKETQARLLVERLKREKIASEKLSFPMYNTPTGKIIGACYLGKEELCNDLFKEPEGWFLEGASNVDALTACGLFAIDRRYNRDKIKGLLELGVNVILDRYVDSNMAHQGGKISDKEERLKLFEKLEILEYQIYEIPKPNFTIFLYVPYQVALELKKKRKEKADQHESNIDHLINAEKTYLELKELHNYITINCVNNNQMRTIEDINEEIYGIVRKLVK